MPRTQRAASESGFYHATTRGNNKQLVFVDDADRLRFLKKMQDLVDEQPVEIHAWCLMGNHVHLLLRTQSINALSKFMRELTSSYAAYFNLRHNRLNALFHSRFWSSPIETDERLLATVRYIHQNPQNAKIGKTDTYRWSSYRAYLQKAGRIQTDLILSMLGSREEFVKFHAHHPAPSIDLLRSEIEYSDEDLLALAREALGNIEPEHLCLLGPKERIEATRKLQETGMKATEIARICHLDKNHVYRMLS